MEGQRDLRDLLALDRTALANERTLLSYGRTALGFLGLALFIFKFADLYLGVVLGSLALAGAAGITVLGIHSYRGVAARIHTEDETTLSASEQLELAVEED